MKRASRPKLTCVAVLAAPTLAPRASRVLWVAGLVALILLPSASRAQSPVSSSYATKDGRASTVILGCSSTNSTYFAEYCGVAGYPLHVTVDSGTVTVNGTSSGGAVPTTTPGTAPSQVVGVQGGGPGALAVAVSAASLPLPSGAASSAQQPELDPNDSGAWSHITNFPSSLTSGTFAVTSLPALPSGSNAIGSVSVSNLPATQPVSGTVGVSSLPALPTGSNAIGSVSVSNLPATQAVSATALPLPSGAATAALQPAINADGGAQVHIMNPTSTTVSGSISVSNFPSTQPVSGTVAVSGLPALPSGTNTIGTVSVGNFPSSQAVSGTVGVSSLPALPAGTNAIGTVSIGNFPTSQAVSGTVGVSSLPALPNGSNAIGSVSVSNLPATQAVSAATLPLPSGAATANNQSSEISSLSTIASNTSGVATAAKQPALNGDGGALTHVSNFPATQPVSASALPLPTGAATAALQPALNSDGGALAHISNFPATQPVSGSVTVASLPALPTGSNAIGSVSVSNLPTTQGVSGTVAVSTLPSLPSGGNAIGSVSVSNLPPIQPVSASALPLPSGAATSAMQAALNSDGGSQVHVQNFPAMQNVGVSSFVQAARSGAWTDASTTATSTAAVPSALAAVAARTGLHLWNVGTATVCMNYTSTAVVSGTGCAAGSVPIPAGSAYLEDQPGNVSPESISLVCTTSSCPLTIKVR